jgi:hypothetical protein
MFLSIFIRVTGTRESSQNRIRVLDERPLLADSNISLLFVAGLFAVASAIAFHAWWPSHKADKDREECVARCVARWQSLESNDAPGDLSVYEILCEDDCPNSGCK